MPASLLQALIDSFDRDRIGEMHGVGRLAVVVGPLFAAQRVVRHV